MDSTSQSKTSFGKLDKEGRSNNLLFTGDPSHWQKQALAYSERLGEDLPRQWPLKTGMSSDTYLRWSRLQIYMDQTRQRRTHHTNKRRNTPKGNNNYQPMCT
jgi:hypothetical protein